MVLALVVRGGRAARREALRGDAPRASCTPFPTFVVNVDGVYDERHLTIIDRELTTGVRHDPASGSARQGASPRRAAACSHQHVIPLGATDATAFAQVGVPTVALLCQDATRLVPNYHTRLDTIEHVRPESLERDAAARARHDRGDRPSRSGTATPAA